MHLNALFCVTFKSAILVHFECIAVHCGELIGVGAPQNNLKKWRGISGLAIVVLQSVFKVTKQTKFLSWENLPIGTIFLSGSMLPCLF